MKKSKRVLASVATVTVFGVFTRILSFIFKIYLSRALGAEAIGLYQIAISVFYLFSALSTGGIPQVLSRKTAQQSALGEEDCYSLLTTALLTGITLALSSIAVLTLLHEHIGFLFSDPLAQPLFLIMLPSLLSTAVYSVIRAFLWGKKEFTAFSVTETVEEGFRILFGVLFVSGVIAGLGGAYAVAVAFTVSDILVAVLLMAIFLIKGGRLTRPSQLRELLLPALPLTAMRLCSGLIGTLIAIILPLRLSLFGMSAAEATASYGRIAGMANPLLLAPNAVIGSLAIVLIPEMSANSAKKEFGLLNKHLNNGINFSFLISGLFMVVYIALGAEITSLLYDDAISGEYLSYAAYIMLPMSLSQLTQSALNSIGKESVSFRNYIIGNVLMLAVIFFLPKYIGIYAVAAANMLSLLTISVLNVMSLQKSTGFSMGFLKHAAMVVLFIFPSAFLATCIYDMLSPKAPIIALIAAATVGSAAYVALCLCTELVDIKGFLRLKQKRPKANSA